MAESITDKAVKALVPPETGNRIVWDATVRGFGVRITAKGVRAFVLDYRASGRQRRLTIGQYPDWTVTAARDEAKRLKREIDLGNDPLAAVEAEREAPTVGVLIDRFKAEVLPRNRPATATEYARMLDDLARPALGRMKAEDVAYRDIAALHRKVSARAPYRANRLVAVLSKMMNWAGKEGLRTGPNPCKGIERNHEDRRERFLSPLELAHLSDALHGLQDRRSADAIRLLLLTGARRGEVLSATWDQFDLSAGVWTKPSAHTKQKKTHRIPLSAPARALLADIRARQDGGAAYLFPGEGADAHLMDVKKAWASATQRATIAMWDARVDTEAGRLVADLTTDGKLPTWTAVQAEAKARGITLSAGLTNVRVHDLRHTFASVLASAGLSLPVIGALLGHTQTATTARYAHLIDDALRAATERAGSLIDAATGPEAEVVPLSRDSQNGSD
ncbi:tyrosine-type recombinase/integrase [Pararhodospirillum oryzae]|uniref:Integrase n=1 Tax=Pararhodospirillum oryzae TaxID=478448 RepID=A0A512H657_9PROT|nr:site-specific integrase [Pararhodospirillum oryzae]GEO80956.1 hypothetical protein ROR02_10870 [Pararhodospirillum oryzae]